MKVSFCSGSACVHGLVGRSVWSVGRLCGRGVAIVGRLCGRAVAIVGRLCGRAVAIVGSVVRKGQLQSSVGCAEEQLQSPVGRAEVQLQPPSSAQEEAQAGALRGDEAIPEVGSPYSSHGGRGGELRGEAMSRWKSRAGVFSCEATGGAKRRHNY